MDDEALSALTARVADGLASVRARIVAAGGDPAAITVVAVTKGFGADAVRAALAAGCGDVGENYAQELGAKAAALASAPAPGGPPRWHAIGRLQRNKVRLLAPHVHLWQSVDRPELVDELARRAPGASVLVQVDLSGEPTKGGCALDEAPRLCERAAAAGLVPLGLMGVGPAGPPEASAPGFAALAALAGRLGLPVRSMGMSGDLEVAVREGSTMVRVGTALLGTRPRPQA